MYVLHRRRQVLIRKARTRKVGNLPRFKFLRYSQTAVGHSSTRPRRNDFGVLYTERIGNQRDHDERCRCYVFVSGSIVTESSDYCTVDREKRKLTIHVSTLHTSTIKWGNPKSFKDIALSWYFNKPTLTTLRRKSIALFQVRLCLPKHPDSKRELKVRICHHTSPIVDPFDGLLCP